MTLPEYRDLGHRIGGDITGGGSGAGARNAITELRPEPAAAKAAEVLAEAGLVKRGTLPHSPKRAIISTPKPLVMPDGALADFNQPVFESGRELIRWAWEVAHGDLVAEVAAGHDLGRRLLAIGQRAAARAGRRLLARRGVAASDTSLQDAASEAVVNILSQSWWPRLQTRGEWWQVRHYLKLVALQAARGAQRSLTGWARVGMTGDNSKAVSWADFAAATLHEAAWPEPGSAEPGSADEAARFSAVRWVYRVGLLQFKAGLPADMHGPARAAQVKAARQRCRCVANLIMGASLDEACAMSGYTWPVNFAESCKRAGFWEALASARAGLLGQHEEQSRVAFRRYALEAAKLKRELDAFGAVTPLRNVKGRPLTFRRSNTLLRWQAWCSLWERYQTAKAKAIHYRDVVKATRAADGKAWAKVSKGWQKGKAADLKALVVPRKPRKKKGQSNRFRIA